MRDLKRLRNIGIAAHIDAGKTTVTERMLYYAGKIHKIGETHDGNTVMDFDKQESKRGITIQSAATQIEWNWNAVSHTINIIDTPGHVDFTIEVERALRVLDGMVVLFDASSGVEPQTETVWRQAERYSVPRIGFVNKMDKLGADYYAVLQDVKSKLHPTPLALQLPIGEEDGFEGLVDVVSAKAFVWEKGEYQAVPVPPELQNELAEHRLNLIEQLAGLDEELMVQYFADPESISIETLQQALRKAVLEGAVFPMFLGTAYKNKGVRFLLDAIAAYLPSPVDAIVEGHDPETNESIVVKVDRSADFSALAFKVVLDDQNRRMTFVRLYSGRLNAGESFVNMRTLKKERVSAMYQMHGGRKTVVKVAEAGDIVALVGPRELRTGDTLATSDAPLLLSSMYIPEPVMGIAVEAKTRTDLEKLSVALAKMMEQDPTFRVNFNAETGQTILRGMGELHLEVLLQRLKDDFEVEVNTGAPEVAYQEAFTKSVVHKERLSQQNGGSGQFAEIHFELSPADPEFLESEAFTKGNRLQFVNEITGGAISKEFIPAVKAGFEAMLDNGALAGYKVENLKIRLFDGAIHQKDSSAQAFERVAKLAFQRVAMLAKPVLKEPIMMVEVNLPEEFMGSVIGSINRRRGLVKGHEVKHGQAVLNALVPLSELFGYVQQVRGLTGGRGMATMTFSHYDEVPLSVQNTVLNKSVNVT